MLNGKWGNLTKKIISSSNGVLFTSIWKQRWPTCHLTTSLLRATAERNLTKLDKKNKYSNVLYQVCSFYSGRWRPPWPLIGWNIFGSFSATLQRNFTKLDWKQVLLASIVYFFRADASINVANGTNAHVCTMYALYQRKVILTLSGPNGGQKDM